VQKSFCFRKGGKKGKKKEQKILWKEDPHQARSSRNASAQDHKGSGVEVVLA
jgi:hypothetical protein